VARVRALGDGDRASIATGDRHRPGGRHVPPLHHRRRTQTAALALTAVVAPLAAGQDLRSPDARDVARQVSPGQDLRSPDARDVAQPRTVVPVRVVTVASDGFDWSDAAIGAGVSFGLAFLLGGSASMISRQRAARRIAA
jgi:hypothetical protein